MKSKRKMRLRINNFRTKLIIAFLIPIVFIVVLGVNSYSSTSKALLESYEQAAYDSIITSGSYFELATRAIELRITQLKGYDNLRDYYAGAYQDDEVAELLQYKELKTYLETTAFADSLISNMGVFCKKGETLCTTGKFEGIGADLVSMYEETEEGMKDIKARGGYTWSGRHDFFDEHLVIDAAKPKIPYAFSISTAYFGKSLKQMGYIIADINDNIVINQLQTMEMGDSSIFTAISSDGYEVSSREQSTVVFTDKEFFQNAISREETSGYSYVDYQGSKHLFMYAKVGTTGITICGLIPYSFLISKANSILTSTMVLTIVAIICAVVVATFISTRMGRTIKKIVHALQKASQGDLTVQSECNRKDELGELSNTSNHMIQNMRALIQKASGVRERMGNSTVEVSKSTNSMAVTAKNISNSIEEIRIGIVQQAEDSEKCLHQSEELSRKVDEVSNSIQSINTLTKDSEHIVKQGVISITELRGKTEETTKITNNVIAEIESLNQESESIGKIIGVITDIAEQTNLLSLNASIEAARAGESGRGFAVVADEIRKLAAQSMKASSEITAIIQNIQEKTRLTVSTVQTSGEIVHSQSIALDSTVQAFDRINSSVENISDQVTKIKEDIDDIIATETTTVGAIESISAVSQETAAASEEVDNAANRQVLTVDTLKHTIDHLNEEAEELNHALSVFQI